MSQKINRRIKWQGESLRVVGNFYPGSKGEMYRYDGSPGDPPEPDTFEIDSIFWKMPCVDLYGLISEMKITDLLCAGERVREDIEKIVMEAMHDDEG